MIIWFTLKVNGDNMMMKVKEVEKDEKGMCVISGWF